MRNELRKKNEENNKARMVAGYCYDWNVKKGRGDYDIMLPYDFKAKWNLASDNIWAVNPNSFEEVGCIHTAQGLEFDYVGVIIGRDLTFDVSSNKVVVNQTAISKDDKSSGIRGLKDKKEARRLILNTYKTLLTRGQKGCYVYCEDKALADYIRQMLAKDTIPAKVVHIEPMINDEAKYIEFLPVYTLRAACGYFEDNISIPDNEAEGWVDIRDTKVKANKNMFVIYASGDSMLPLIKDGDLCVFELYGPDNAGSREGEIVLTQCLDKDLDYDCHYTIKKYHSTWHYDEFGRKIHDSVELIPLNKEGYETRTQQFDDEIRTIGIFRGVVL